MIETGNVIDRIPAKAIVTQPFTGATLQTGAGAAEGNHEPSES
jgi:hypothetical protein